MSQPTALTDLLARLDAGLDVDPAIDPAIDLVVGPGADLGLPAWLAQLLAALFDGQERAAAHGWTARIHAALTGLKGQVPFTVVHDWHAGTVVPLLDGVCADQAAVGALHARALAGAPVTEAQWAAALEPALREVYLWAYAYDDAYQVNYDSASAYGTAHGFGAEGTREYATYYAELATGANLRACADANALAQARGCAAAFATAGQARYARTYPYAAARGYAHAYVRAAANPGNAGGQNPETPQAAQAYARLAEGLAGSLDRAAEAPPNA